MKKQIYAQTTASFLTLIISWCVITNSEPGKIRVAKTAALEWAWITAPASRRKLVQFLRVINEKNKKKSLGFFKDSVFQNNN